MHETNLHEFLNTRYEILTPFDNTGRNVLVREKGGNRLLIRKEISKDVWDIANIWIAIQNEHMVHIEEIYTSKERYYILERFIAGKTLAELLEEKTVLDRNTVLSNTIVLLDTLTRIHDAGIVHRDITPSNIMISDDGVLKLLDFGIARVKDPSKTRDTRLLGTEGYAAPEQFGFKQTDDRSDLYAVGVLLNVMLTGKHPGEFMYPTGKLSEIIQKATSIDPKDRYPSAQRMRQELAILYEPPLIRHTGETEHHVLFSILPGFRNNIRRNEICAISVYSICGFLIVLFTLGDLVSPRPDSWKELLSVYISFGIPPFIAGNLFYWDTKIPLLNRTPKWFRITLRLILAFIVFFMGISIYFLDKGAG